MKILSYFKKILIFALTIFSMWCLYVLLLVPSNDKYWIVQQKILAYWDITPTSASIHNVRNFNYNEWWETEINYYDKVYELDKIKSLDFILVPFALKGLIAHSFLSFWFEDGSYVSFSIEWRKEVWESYHPVTWLFRWYELIYVVWDERDLVDLRINHDKDKVYLYPIVISKEKNINLFLSMLNRVNRLNQTAEFYNTLLDNCTISLWKHVKDIWSNKIPFNFWLIASWLSDKYLLKYWLIDSDATNIDELREKHLITEFWEKYEDSKDFSIRIRENIKLKSK